MVSIQEEALRKYQSNLGFLKQNNYKLYSKIEELSSLIDNNKYKERFYLEYIEETKSFDLYDTQTNKFLYENKVEKFNQELENRISLDTKGSFSFLKDTYYNQKEVKVISENTSYDMKMRYDVANDIYEYTSILGTFDEHKEKNFSSLSKLIFFGTLLGIHIDKISKKYKLKTIFICDTSLEMFRLSLFVVDYKEISLNTEIVFSILDSDEEFYQQYSLFIKKDFQENHYIKHCFVHSGLKKQFDKILESIYNNDPFNFSYRKYLDSILKPTCENIKKYNIINTKKNYSFLKDIPILFVAAGPSLDNSINWLKENQNKFFIVSVGGSVNKLILANIKIDLIITVDAEDRIVRQFPSEIKENISNIPVLASAMTHKEVLKQFSCSNIFIFETMTKIKEDSEFITGASVGDIGIKILFKLGMNNLYMLGTDLSIDKKTGLSHISGYDDCVEYNLEEENKTSALNSNSVIYVRGNFEEKVPTTLIFNRTILQYSKIFELELRKKDTKIYNISNGAFISNTKSLDKSKINLNNITEKISIKNYLKEISSNSLVESEILTLEKENFLDKLLEKLENMKSQVCINNEEFELLKSDIINMIQNTKSRIGIDFTLMNYIKIVEPYFYFCLNKESILNNEETIEKIKSIWISHMKKLCIEFICALR